MKDKMIECWCRLRAYVAGDSGVSTVEYALIVVAVIAIVGLGITTLGGSFNDLFNTLEDELEKTVSKAKSISG